MQFYCKNLKNMYSSKLSTVCYVSNNDKMVFYKLPSTCIIYYRCCRRRLYDWLKVAPYESRVSDDDDEEWDASNGI